MNNFRIPASYFRIPASCPSCGALFASRGISLGNNAKNVTLSENYETCPFCNGWASIADGVFDVADGVLSMISGPNITKQMLVALGTAVKNAHEEKKPAEELAKEVEKIDPKFGDVIRRSGANNLYATLLLLITAALHSCTLDIKLDANRLIDQIQDQPPAAVSASPK